MIGRNIALGCAAAALLASHPVSAGEKSAEVSAMPADAEIVFASSMAGGMDPWGFPARELYVSKADGSGLTQITHAGFSHNHFAVSPDRTKIFTNRYSRGDTSGDGKIDYRDFKELWLIDLTTRTERRVLEGIDGGWGGVAWSPDSQYVYYGIRTSRGGDIQRWRIDGGTPEVITANMNGLLGMPGNVRWMSDVDLSPDGKWLAMVYSNGPREGEGVKRKNRIAIYKVDGTAARIITDGGDLPAGALGMWSAGDYDPDFSPDGKSVSFMRFTGKMLTTKPVSSADIMRQNLDGSGLARVSAENNPDEDGISSWGGPRCQITYAKWNDRGPTFLEMVDPDGGHRTQAHFKGEASHVQWIPVPNERAACK